MEDAFSLYKSRLFDKKAAIATYDQNDKFDDYTNNSVKSKSNTYRRKLERELLGANTGGTNSAMNVLRDFSPNQS